ncbi:hypothetical protein LIA77_05222 [Sarocladium implicatum]|nr:hypothetical protein LIA77_05222 [Sarocladium implicatum]
MTGRQLGRVLCAVCGSGKDRSSHARATGRLVVDCSTAPVRYLGDMVSVVRFVTARHELDGRIRNPVSIIEDTGQVQRVKVSGEPCLVMCQIVPHETNRDTTRHLSLTGDFNVSKKVRECENLHGAMPQLIAVSIGHRAPGSHGVNRLWGRIGPPGTSGSRGN